MILNSFLTVVWQFNPTFVRIGTFDIRWYGVMWAVAIGLGAYFFTRFCKREGLPAKLADSIFIYGALATIIGSRLGHCLFYEPGYYLADPIKILAFRDGGMASHGAAVGLLIGLWLFSRHNRMPYLWSLDRVMIPVAVGGAFVRLHDDPLLKDMQIDPSTLMLLYLALEDEQEGSANFFAAARCVTLNRSRREMSANIHMRFIRHAVLPLREGPIHWLDVDDDKGIPLVDRWIARQRTEDLSRGVFRL